MLKGIDVSKWQPAGTVDFGPYDFVITKATEGIGYTDLWGGLASHWLAAAPFSHLPAFCQQGRGSFLYPGTSG